MKTIINEPYHKLIEGTSSAAVQFAMLRAMQEDLARASTAGIRLIGGIKMLRPRPGVYALHFQPMAEMKA